MEIFNTIAGFLQRIFQWWFTVMPWEQAIRVRAGKRAKLLKAGLYLRIPFVDAVYVQTTRMRMADSPMQTMSTKDGNTITVKSVVGYVIDDVQKLYNTLTHPEMTLASMSMGLVGDYVRSKNISEITPAAIEDFVAKEINATQYGLKDFSIKIVTFAIVKTFRLIQDGTYMGEGLNMQPIK